MCVHVCVRTNNTARGEKNFVVNYNASFDGLMI